MPSTSADLTTRITTLSAVLTSTRDRQLVATALQAANGNWSIALDQLKGKLEPASLQKASLAHSLAELTGDNVGVVTTLATQPNVTSLRDLALNFSPSKLAAIVPAQHIPPDVPGDTPAERAKNYASELHNKLFASETSAVLQRMVQESEVPIADSLTRSGVVGFLDNQPAHLHDVFGVPIKPRGSQAWDGA